VVPVTAVLLCANCGGKIDTDRIDSDHLYCSQRCADIDIDIDNGSAVVADRSRDVSEELTEVRTVLSRARHARETVRQFRDGEKVHVGTWDYTTTPSTYLPPDVLSDPDTVAMVYALDVTIAALERWQRTGRTPK
jgi:endogenous inhibitor of DNA gyrase (YacG/DUF329 family)